ncbi:DUF2958 domain-containing protein [Tersicoccus sp. MR15.9]|uniref:DUF2958 domain-containing protein n=1 Tax=Tersicoccus mangrovi TaxID=3121635 RepID=UPI002FE58A8A
MSTPTIPNRQPAGAPNHTGGRFAETAHTEADLTLTAPRPVLTETLRERRGHDFYPTEASSWPALYATDGTSGIEDKPFVAHYFRAGADWYVAEFDPVEREAFGYADLGLGHGEYGYIALDELEQLDVDGAVVERDLDFVPGTRAYECIEKYRRAAPRARTTSDPAWHHKLYGETAAGEEKRSYAQSAITDAFAADEFGVVWTPDEQRAIFAACFNPDTLNEAIETVGAQAIEPQHTGAHLADEVNRIRLHRQAAEQKFMRNHHDTLTEAQQIPVDLTDEQYAGELVRALPFASPFTRQNAVANRHMPVTGAQSLRAAAIDNEVQACRNPNRSRASTAGNPDFATHPMTELEYTIDRMIVRGQDPTTTDNLEHLSTHQGYGDGARVVAQIVDGRLAARRTP